VINLFIVPRKFLLWIRIYSNYDPISLLISCLQAIHQESGVIALPLSQYEEMESKLNGHEQAVEEIRLQLEFFEVEKRKFEENMDNMRGQLLLHEREISETKAVLETTEATLTTAKNNLEQKVEQMSNHNNTIMQQKEVEAKLTVKASTIESTARIIEQDLCALHKKTASQVEVSPEMVFG
jgi:chromosome segregation ATPase